MIFPVPPPNMLLPPPYIPFGGGNPHFHVMKTPILPYDPRKPYGMPPPMYENSRFEPALMTYRPKHDIVCKTLICYLISPDGREKLRVRVLLDSGSQVCLMRRAVADHLGFCGPTKTLELCGIGNTPVINKHEFEVQFRLEAIDGSYVTEPIVGCTIPKISRDLSAIYVAPQLYPHLKDINFTENYPWKPDGRKEIIDVLLGEPVQTFLSKGGPRVGESMDQPCAQNTHLGWTLAGSQGLRCNATQYNVLNAGVPCPDLERFWALDIMGVKENEDTELTLDEHQALEKIKKVTRFVPVIDENSEHNETGIAQGYWVTKLLWKDLPVDDTNVRRARAVAHRIVKSYARDKEKTEMINAAVRKWFDGGFAEPIPHYELKKTENYHVVSTFPVFQRGKVRMVFQANEKLDDGLSLNQKLLVGPTLLPDLCKLLIKFRLNPVVFTCDIKSMFLQIKLEIEDRNYLRFFHNWGEVPSLISDTKKETYNCPKYSRMSSLAFGLVSSPFQATWILRENAKRFEKLWPEAVKLINNSCYVDDQVAYAKNTEQGKNLVNQIRKINQSGNFNTHKWLSNCPKILEDIPDEDKAESSTQKILGVTWKSTPDLLIYNFMNETASTWKPKNKDSITKRECLSLISTIFDPLGLIAPVSLIAKMIMQKTWKAAIAWDEPLPHPLQDEFQKWMVQVPTLENIPIQRCLMDCSDFGENPKSITKPIRLICMVDASEYSYAATVHLVSAKIDLIRTEDGVIEGPLTRENMKAALVFSKARVKPTKAAKQKPAIAVSKAHFIPVKSARKKKRKEKLATATARIKSTKSEKQKTSKMDEKEKIEDSMSIPRMELMSAVLGAKIGKYVRDTFLEMDIDIPMYYFSDSQITLFRISRDPLIYKTWVAHRLQKIHELTERSQWYYVNTQYNIADLPSRGCSAEELLKHPYWFKGPEFIRQPETDYVRVGKMNKSQLNVLENETKKVVPTFNVASAIKKSVESKTKTPQHTFFEKLHDWALKHQTTCDSHVSAEFRNKPMKSTFQAWKPMVRVIAWIRRFAQNCKVKRNDRRLFKDNKKANYEKIPRIDSSEYKEAEMCLFKYAQETTFSEEISTLKKNGELKRQYQNLDLYIDPETGLIQVNSRLRLSNFQTTWCNPILLPKNHFVTNEYVMSQHKLTGHAPTETVLNNTRRRVWIIGGRRSVKSILSKCRCKLFKTVPAIEKMAPLPAVRIDVDMPWMNISCDWFEGLNTYYEIYDEELKEWKIHKFKAYGLIFSDLYTRAINVEVMEDSTTLSFIAGIQRHAATWGDPKSILCDRAKSFLKGSQEIRKILKDLDWIQIQNSCDDKGTTFYFSTERAPWQNATSEASVKLIKTALKAAIGPTALEWKDLVTMVKEATAIVNQRPLGLCFDDIHNPTSICPSELILGRPQKILPDGKKTTILDKPLSRKWNKRRVILNHFWRRFQKDYLQHLAITRKWHRSGPVKLRVGQYVQVREENFSKGIWRYGVITKLHEKTYRDGSTRITRVELRVNDRGKIRNLARPVQRLSVFEHDIPSDSAHKESPSSCAACVLMTPCIEESA